MNATYFISSLIGMGCLYSSEQKQTFVVISISRIRVKQEKEKENFDLPFLVLSFPLKIAKFLFVCFHLFHLNRPLYTLTLSRSVLPLFLALVFFPLSLYALGLILDPFIRRHYKYISVNYIMDFGSNKEGFVAED